MDGMCDDYFQDFAGDINMYAQVTGATPCKLISSKVIEKCPLLCFLNVLDENLLWRQLFIFRIGQSTNWLSSLVSTSNPMNHITLSGFCARSCSG